MGVGLAIGGRLVAVEMKLAMASSSYPRRSSHLYFCTVVSYILHGAHEESRLGGRQAPPTSEVASTVALVIGLVVGNRPHPGRVRGLSQPA